MTDLTNKRILIVEDNGLIGEVVAEMVTEAGGWAIGPAMTERDALDMIDYNPGRPDAAILDLGLDVSSIEVARRLLELNVPFVFATGTQEHLPGEFAHVPVVQKPYAFGDLRRALSEAFERPGPVIVVKN